MNVTGKLESTYYEIDLADCIFPSYIKPRLLKLAQNGNLPNLSLIGHSELKLTVAMALGKALDFECIFFCINKASKSRGSTYGDKVLNEFNQLLNTLTVYGSKRLLIFDSIGNFPKKLLPQLNDLIVKATMGKVIFLDSPFIEIINLNLNVDLAHSLKEERFLLDDCNKLLAKYNPKMNSNNIDVIANTLPNWTTLIGSEHKKSIFAEDLIYQKPKKTKNVSDSEPAYFFDIANKASQHNPSDKEKGGVLNH